MCVDRRHLQPHALKGGTSLGSVSIQISQRIRNKQKLAALGKQRLHGIRAVLKVSVSVLGRIANKE